MKDFDQKSLQILELPLVLEQLAKCAVSEAAKLRARALTPFTHEEDVRRALRETSDAKALSGLRGAPPFAGIRDVSASLTRAGRGGSLNCKELLDVAMLLKTARMVRGYRGDDAQQKTSLDGLFSALSANKFLEDAITGAILSEEEIADGASPALSDIRRKMRAANAKIRDVLQRMISSPTQSKLLQEPIITQRGGRYVVPVKSEHKADVGGLVHDISSSGATLFIEPMPVVALNNDLRELEAKEKKEIERILMELSASVADFTETIARDYDLLVNLDFIFAKAKLSYDWNADAPEVNTCGQVSLRRARHPLLDAKKTVPVSIRLGLDFDTLIITGPNTGGKTVALKTIGLLNIMAQCGLHIPCDSGSCVSVFGHVFADIGDEQSIEQSLSTFSSHMTNIVGILQQADDASLILFDELGAGPDPVEGAALAVSIIQYARALGAKVAATTHYTELKTFALTTNRVENASCEFDVETLRPTYKLLIGVPGKSNAFAISKRLGLPEHIIDDARGLIDSEDQRFDEILAKLEEKNTRLEEELRGAERARREAEELRRRAEEFDATIEKDRDRALERAKAEAERLIASARDTADQVFEELDSIRKKRRREENYQQVNDARAALRRSLNEAEGKLDAIGKKKQKPKAEPMKRPLKIGDTVELISLGTRATVLTLPDKNGNLQVQAGIMKVNVKLRELRLVEESGDKTVRDFVAKKQAELRNIQVSPEIDLRGMMPEEAESVLERYIDTAFLAKLNTVTVIHGKGTGVLRRTVQEHLKHNRQVKSFRLGVYGEGENGVTVVELRQ